MIFRWVLFVLLSVLCGSLQAANVIQTENAKPGNSDWTLSNPGDNPTVEGYASATSVGRGETIRFFISSTSPTYTYSIYRMGWYNGAGARRMVGPITMNGAKRAVPAPDANGMVDANWPESFNITIPNTADHTDWASGIYLMKLTDGAGGPASQSYVIFVVRDDSSTAPYLLQSTATTSQAYNNWGGKSLYAWNSVDGAPARKVSFNRPYAMAGAIYMGGSGNFLDWEINFLRFIEKEGYDVTYASNLDLHTRGAALMAPHKAFIVSGHDEYWSYEMRAAIKQSQDAGKHLAFFAANEAYWQIRFESDANGNPNRTIVGYKEAAQSSDPLALDADKSNDRYITTRFRDLGPVFGVTDPVVSPENAMVGVQYHGDPFNGDIVVSDASSWVYGGTGVVNGSRFTGLLGYETDAIADNGWSPPGLQKIADSPDTFGGSHMTTYTTPSGSVVFATGSMAWVFGLDNFGQRGRVSAAAQQATRNVLARIGTPPLNPPTSVAAVGGAGRIDVSWVQAAGATSYNIYRGTSSGSETLFRPGISGGSFADTGLAASTKYFYRVASANGTSESALSNEVSATTNAAPVETILAPTNLSGSANAQGQMTLYWTPSATPNVDKTYVYRKFQNQSWVIIAILPGNASTWFDTSGNSSGSRYYYFKVAAVKGTVISPTSNQIRID